MRNRSWFSLVALIGIIAVFIFTPMLDARAGGNTQTVEGVTDGLHCTMIWPAPNGASIPEDRLGPCGPISPWEICVYTTASNAHTFEMTPGTQVVAKLVGRGAALCSRGLEFTLIPQSCGDVIWPIFPQIHVRLECLVPASGQLTFTISALGAVAYTLSVSEIEPPEPPIVPIVPIVEPPNPETLAGLQRINQPASTPYIIYVPTAERAAAENTQFIDIWRLDDNAIGQPLLYISKEDLLALPAYPAENLLIATSELVNVYKLTTGEYQVNIGPLADGKVYTTIFDAIPPTQITHSTWE